MQGTDGDWSGLEELRKDLRAYLVGRCHDENELEDVIHETFLRAVRYRGKGVRKLRPWAFRIARNVLRDHHRREVHIQDLGGEAPEEAILVAEEPEEEPEYRFERWTLDREAALGALTGALARLKPDDQRVLSSFYQGEGTSRATARECEIPHHLVKIRLFRARRRLLRALRQRLALTQGPTLAEERLA